jgi:hypothetical protein
LTRAALLAQIRPEASRTATRRQPKLAVPPGLREDPR